ncbi:MAG: cobalamin B12-binding domain-containing protein, partial [Hyphomonadaceae bacterium]|nr:cobalamin B12-binding domain-containing protein [Clostridia bacterium]
DGLVMTVSADQAAPHETLKVIEYCSEQLGCPTIVGLSNVSFGLPERKFINAAFWAMAIGHGLSMAIANPSADMITDLKMAADVLTGRDKGSIHYVTKYAHAKKPAQISTARGDLKPMERIAQAVLEGDKDNIKTYINQVLLEGETASNIVDDVLIPAITQVGKNYEQRIFFLPQLIGSAETMKAAFEVLEPLLAKDKTRDQSTQSVVVLATVKGDIHDIGKNIVGLMLKNYGFVVHDLGKDVSAEVIVQKAIEVDADIIGLSALMTTTMVEMKSVVKLAKEAEVSAKIMIGGAVVDQAYADEIGADGYSMDAYEAVKLAKQLAMQ